jgi:hypothetical protein
MKVKMPAAALVSAALLLGLAASASAHGVPGHTITVSPGDSIQAAIDKAQPGDTIKLRSGTFHESVNITKSNLTVTGSGAKSTRIVPPPSPAPPCGFCVSNSDDQGNIISTVANIHISRLTVDGFSEFGIFYFGTSGGRVDHTIASNDGGYGMVAFNSSNTRFEWNATFNDGEAGLYIGDSPQANAVVHGNTAWNNKFGVLVRDATFGEVSHNWLFNNCTGLMFLDTPAPGGAGNFTAKDNRTVANNKACPADAEEGAPPFSGAGILVVGAHDLDIHHNAALFNNPSGPAAASGGIVLVSGQVVGTSPESNNRVAFNVALHNDPFDLSWDGAGTGNVFVGNVCKTSNPAGLCAKQGNGGEANGGHGNGDQGNGGQGHGNGGHHGHHKHHRHNHHKHHKHHRHHKN